MRNLYLNSLALHKMAIDRFSLTQSIIDENLVQSIRVKIKSLTHNNSLIYIVINDNYIGNLGLKLARALNGDMKVKLLIASELKSNINIKNYEILKSIGVEICNKLYACDILIDCLLDSEEFLYPTLYESQIIKSMNATKARYKLAIGISSGASGNAKYNDRKIGELEIFKATHTIALGALNIGLFAPNTKDYIGALNIANIGISKDKLEISSNYKLLQSEDLALKERKLDCHKGDFGHLYILSHEKDNASVISGLAALRFGAGKVSLLNNSHCIDLINCQLKPASTTAIALGMGLFSNISPSDKKAVEEEIQDLIEHDFYDQNILLDADILNSEFLIPILQSAGSAVLTPHYKEFVSMLKRCEIADITIEGLKSDIFAFVHQFINKFQNVVLLLKGSNTIIAHKDRIYIDPTGSPSLATGGSGDVLSGLIASLLAQGISPLDSAITGSLALSLASGRFASYALTPSALIEAIGDIKPARGQNLDL